MASYLVYSLLDKPNDEVGKLKDRLESLAAIPGRIPGFESLGGGYFRKRLGSYRLLARLLTILTPYGSYPVVVFVDYLHRGDRLYADAPAEEMRARYEPRIEQELPNIQKYGAERVDNQRSTPPLPPPPPPPSSLLSLLDRIDPPELDTTIYESECWVSSQQKLRTNTEHAAIYKLLSETIVGGKEPGYGHQSQEGCQVHFYRLNDPEYPLQHIFLLGILSSKWSHDDYDEIQRQIEVLRGTFERQVIAPLHEKRGNRKQFIDSVSRLSRRAYPSYLLADEELWQSVRDQQETFLALSTEEINVLSEMREGRYFPCVIEGRAGSGKSTLLIHHTAERLSRSGSRSNTSDASYRLLFVTQSESLVKKSQELIEKLQHRLAQEHGVQQPLLHAEFQTFQAFALEQLAEEHQGRFLDRTPKGGWINFDRFRDLLKGQGPDGFREDYRHRANAEAVWFTLRSYIKGFHIHALDDDRWMSFEEYRDEEIVPRKDRQISEELFENVWKRVWPWYRRLTIPCHENDGQPRYWDDLDLAWEVLLHRRPDAPDYTVIVCDEVQDLTRVELAALLQALLWGRYDLSGIRPLCLPIVMAGDAHQTVNPACFRWARVRADITKAMVQQLLSSQPDGGPSAEVRALELSYNYRNAHAIALLCNAIQQLRQTTLGHSAVLQKPWREADAEPNQRIRRLLLQPKEDAQWFEELKSVWLVAPEPADPEIESAREFWQALGVPLTRKLENCDTPMTIKGLEQPFVALVGFGTRFAQLSKPRFWSWQRAVDDPNVPENDRFAIEYFLNRLYVAVSRAQEQLWIIETEEGWKSFWEPFEQWLKQQHQNEANDQRSNFGFHYSDGDLNELLHVDEKRWPELAQQSEQLAHEQRDANHAERAAFYYGRMGNSRKSAEMRAYQEYYQGNIREAARRMVDMGNREKAVEWYWEAAAWDELVRAGIPGWRHSIAHLMAQATETRGREWVDSLLTILENPPASRVLNDVPLSGGPTWSTWQKVLLELLSEAVRLPQTEKSLKIRAELCLSPYAPRFYASPHFRDWQQQWAQLAFDLERWRQAAEGWEAIHDTKRKEYYLAKARSTTYPESLQWWESANEWAEILKLWNADAHKDRLDRKDLQRVVRAYRETCQWNAAFNLAVVMDKDVDDKDITIETWKAICTHGQCSEEDLIRIIDAAFDTLSTKLDKEDLPRCWTMTLHALLRATVESDPDSQNNQKSAETWARTLVYGFRHQVDHRGITSRLENAWNKGPKDRAWTSGSKLLKQIIQQCRSLVEREWQQGQFEEAALLAYLVLHLLWNFPQRMQDNSHSDDVPRDQPEWRPYLQRQEKVASVNYLAQIEAEFHEQVYQALECVGAGPPDWIRQVDPRGDAVFSRDHSTAAKSEEDRDLDTAGTILNRLLKIVDSLSYDLLKNLQDTRKTAQRREDMASVRWWLTVGRFIEQAPFRRRALDFYRELRDLAQEYYWSREDQQKITERLQDYERRYEAWRRQRNEPSSRPTVVEPGQSKDSDILIVYCRSDRNGAVIQLKPDLDQIRFSPPNTGDQEPEIRFPDGLRDIRRLSNSKEEIIWRFPWQGRTVALQWNSQNRELLILADRNFVVTFRR